MSIEHQIKGTCFTRQWPWVEMVRKNLNRKLNLTGLEELTQEMRTRKTSKPVSIVHFRTLDGELKTSRENYAK